LIKQPKKNPGRFKQVINNKLLNINYLKVFLEALIKKVLHQIADDFLLGLDNSVCMKADPITEAKPL